MFVNLWQISCAVLKFFHFSFAQLCLWSPSLAASYKCFFLVTENGVHLKAFPVV